MPAHTRAVDNLQAFVDRLHECHELPVYEAIERLVHAAEEIGLDSDTLLRMLDRDMAFEELLEFIEAKMECLQKAAVVAHGTTGSKQSTAVRGNHEIKRMVQVQR